jgi:hypothetical protein
MTPTRRAVLSVITLLLATTAWAQEFPRHEITLDYTYAHYVPSTSYAKATNQSLNGGGGAYVYNFTPHIGMKMDLQGYGSFSNQFVIPVSTNFPQGGLFRVNGNLFTYLFGPQVKIRAHSAQPFGHLLVGAAHSNLYGSAYKECGTQVVCSGFKAPSGNAFAFAIGGGVDVPLGTHIQLRPAGFDYLLTNFSNPFNHGSQSNWRYMAGMTFTLGGAGTSKY